MGCFKREILEPLPGLNSTFTTHQLCVLEGVTLPFYFLVSHLQKGGKNHSLGGFEGFISQYMVLSVLLVDIYKVPKIVSDRINTHTH